MREKERCEATDSSTDNFTCSTVNIELRLHT